MYVYIDNRYMDLEGNIRNVTLQALSREILNMSVGWSEVHPKPLREESCA